MYSTVGERVAESKECAVHLRSYKIVIDQQRPVTRSDQFPIHHPVLKCASLAGNRFFYLWIRSNDSEQLYRSLGNENNKMAYFYCVGSYREFYEAHS